MKKCKTIHFQTHGFPDEFADFCVFWCFFGFVKYNLVFPFVFDVFETQKVPISHEFTNFANSPQPQILDEYSDRLKLIKFRSTHPTRVVDILDFNKIINKNHSTKQKYVEQLKKKLAKLPKSSKQWRRINRELLNKKSRLTSIPTLRDDGEVVGRFEIQSRCIRKYFFFEIRVTAGSSGYSIFRVTWRRVAGLRSFQIAQVQ